MVGQLPSAAFSEGPLLGRALSGVAALRNDLEGTARAPGHIVLTGFGRGACPAIEVTARWRPCPATFSAAGKGKAACDELYGHAGKPSRDPSRHDGLPILLGRHEEDPRIPLARARRSAAVLGDMGARTRPLVIPGAGHGVASAELDRLRNGLRDAA